MESLTDFHVSKVEALTLHVYTAACQQALGRDDEAVTGVGHVKQAFSNSLGCDIANRYPFACYFEDGKGERLSSLLHLTG